MKKLAIFVLVLSMLFIATSCELYQFIEQLPTGGNDPTVNPDGTINYVEMSAADYDVLNELMEDIGNNFTVKVRSENRGAVLNAEYVITEDKITYTVESLAMLPEDGDISKLPVSMVESRSGEAIRGENGDILDDDNNAVVLPEGDTVKGNIRFDEGFFRNGKRSPSGFEGDVISVSSFLGVKMSVDSMKVRVDYTDSAITSIVLYYVKDGANVTVTYEFN